MRPAPLSWFCPVCVHELEPALRDCPQCGAAAEWLDLLRAFDFAIRRYQLWKCQGILSAEEYRDLLAHCRCKREAWVRSASLRHPAPEHTGLPNPRHCWSCKHPTKPLAGTCPSCGSPLETEQVRILRFHAFLCNEVRLHYEAGRLTSSQWEAAMSDTPARQIELLQRLGRCT